MSSIAPANAETRPESNRRKNLAELDWVLAALEALAAGGIEQVRIDQLATRLAVTKGSFYWHFKNREELLNKMAHRWGEWQLDTASLEAVQAPGPPLERLSTILAAHEEHSMSHVDRAMRAWALSDERAAKAVRKADTRLENLLTEIFVDLGFSEMDAILRTRILLLCGIGREVVGPHEREAELLGSFFQLLTGPVAGPKPEHPEAQD